MPSIQIAGRTVLFDKEDSHHFEQLIWTVRMSGTTCYVQRCVYRDGKYVGVESLHRLVTNCPSDMVVDHINGDGLDNRRANLRVCTQAENVRNRRIHSNNRSGFKGVYFDPSSTIRSWRAKISINGKRIRLGRYASAEEAHKAYKAAAKQYHGEFARAG